MLAEFHESNESFKAAFGKWQKAIEKNAAHRTVVLFHQKTKQAADRYNLIATVLAALTPLVNDKRLQQTVLEAFDNAIAEDFRDYPAPDSRG